MKTVLLDLDGTLLKMDVEQFTKYYFGLLAEYCADEYEPKKLIETVAKGTYAMIKNDGSMTNEQRFASVFRQCFNEEPNNDKFLEFYRTEFKKTINACSVDGDGRQLVDALKKRGYRLILATNPLFPQEGTKQRMGFVNLKLDDFELVTTYENCHYCKPNIAYYEEILEKIGESSENCIMIGNDVDEDMVTKQLGMKTVLLTDCLINKHQKALDFDYVMTIKDLIAKLEDSTFQL